MPFFVDQRRGHRSAKRSAPRRALACPFLVLLSLVTLPLPRAGAQATAPTAGQVGQVGGSYVLDQDDVIAVIVNKHADFGVADVKIPASGVFRLPVVGDVRATGRTLDQLDDEITHRLKVRLRNPEVTVLLKQARPRLVFVNGTAVTRPGPLELRPGWRVTDALAAAGGLGVRAEQVDAALDRPGQISKSLNLSTLLADSSLPSNVLLRPGDTLRFVPRLVPVSINGQVAKPGNYDVPRGHGVREAIAQAGGTLADRAAPSRVTIQRGAQTIAVNLFEIEKSPEKNLAVEAGDSILVPEATEMVLVMGAVAKPGAVRIADGREMTLTEAIAQAGSPQPNAALSKVTLKRDGGEIVPLDLNKLLVLGQGIADPKVNFALQNGDTLLIPVAQTRIHVSGAVLKPGFIEIEDGRTLRVDEAIALAGNPTEKAALTRANLKRGTQTIPLNLYPLIALGRSDQTNLELQDGDKLTIPEARGVSVLGAVAKSSVVFLEEGAAPRLRDALAQVGSLAPGVKPEEVRISVLRSIEEKQQLFSINAVALLGANDPAQNIALRDGDSINVASIERPSVTILGEIARPDSYELREGEGVADLIARAGGPTLFAALRKVEVRRGEQKLVADVLAAVKGGAADKATDMVLQNGDSVVVPRNTALVSVGMAVRQPGKYPIPEDGQLTVMDALEKAGGYLNAKLKEVAILREGPDGKTQEIDIKLNQVQSSREAANQVLQPGDVLFVPQEKLRESTGKLSIGLGLLRLLIP